MWHLLDQRQVWLACWAGACPLCKRPAPHGPDLVIGLAAAGYHTACVGGVGFFNNLSPLGAHLPSLFAESHWEPAFGATSPTSFEAQLDRVEAVIDRVPWSRRLFLLVNVAALHQPNHFYLAGATGDSRATHAAALQYVDRHVARLFALVGRRRPCFVVACSDHGIAYVEDGYEGHRIGHEVVWTVPYAEFVIGPGARS